MALVVDVEPGDDVTLMEARLGARDERVVALFNEHYTRLCRLATMLLRDPAGAEEAVQEAFIRTFTSWWRIRRPDRASAYLQVAVVNQCRSRLRRRTSENRGNRAAWAREELRTAPDAGSPEEHHADAIRVIDAVEDLPPRQQEAVILFYFHDLSEAEVAAALGCSCGTIKSQLSKARAALERRLSAGEGESP